MKDIVEAIKEKRDAILRLQADLDVLEKARALLNGGVARQAVTLADLGETPLARNDRVRSAHRKLHRTHPMKGKVNPRSSVGMTIAVLRESGVPLHIGEILGRLKKRGGDAKKTSLTSTLIRHSKQGKIFFKPEASTFGLLEWQQATAVDR